MQNLSDKEIIQGCIINDKPIQTELVKRFTHLVYGAIKSAYKTKQVPIVLEDVDDLHNTVFVSLLEKHSKKLQQYEGRNGCSLASWVRMIAVRTTLDHFRKKKDALYHPDRCISLEFLSNPSPGSLSVLDRMEYADQIRILTEEMKNLLPRDRLVLTLHCLDELPIQKVADILKVTENNIHSVKHRAVKRLKEKIRTRLNSENFP